MRLYRTFEIAPDFRRPPEGGVYVPRTDTTISGAATFSRWPSRNARTQTFTLVLKGPTEVRTFREFLGAVRGNWQPFYIPSWTRDFGATNTVAIGDRTIRIDENPSDWVASDRPDTFGRTVYIFTPANQLLVARVLTSTNNGDGTWDLLLDRPFPWAADLAKCLCGIAWFVHFAGQEFMMEHVAPDRLEVEVGVIEGRNRSSIEATYAITPVAIYESEPFDTLIEEDADPWVADFRTVAALGPDNYNTAQDLNFSVPWTFTLEDGDVTFTDGVATETSALYDGDDTPTWISGAFDGLGREALAWQSSFETTRLRWYDSGTPQALNLTARTAVLFQNWTINGSITAGDADVVCYYLKPGDAKIFARYQRDSFATEYTAAVSPVSLLALVGNAISGQNHVLRAISSRHTRLSFQSEDYLLPIPRQRDETTSQERIDGAVNLMVIDEAADEDTDTTARATETLTGAVNFMVIDLPVDEIEDTEARGTETLTGALNFMVIDADGTNEDDEISSSETTTGAYNQIARDASSSDDETTSTETITGSYAPP